MLSLPCLDRVEPDGQAKVFIWRKVGPARRVTLPSRRGDPAGRNRVTLLTRQLFVFHVNGLLRFISKCRKSWLFQGSSVKRVLGDYHLLFAGRNGLYVTFNC